MKKLTLASLSILAAVVLVASGCGADTATSSKAAARRPSAPTCPATWRPGWQRLANRIHAPVYCPSWLPDPLTGAANARTFRMLSSLNSSALGRRLRRTIAMGEGAGNGQTTAKALIRIGNSDEC